MVSADGGYVENAFLLPLDEARLQLMVDVHCDHLVWFARYHQLERTAGNLPKSN